MDMLTNLLRAIKPREIGMAKVFTKFSLLFINNLAEPNIILTSTPSLQNLSTGIMIYGLTVAPEIMNSLHLLVISLLLIKDKHAGKLNGYAFYELARI